jgi:aryl-alcohol dehydrogenase-like predicted oxidoreductase
MAQPGATALEFRRGGMVYRRLGETDLHVSLLSFGSHTDPAYKRQVGDGTVLNEEGQARRDRQIAHALDLGVNMVDTYESEGAMGTGCPAGAPATRQGAGLDMPAFPQFVGDDIDKAAKLYGHVDLFRIYPGEGPQVDDRALEDWDVMRKAKETGKVRALGISTHSEALMLSALQELEGLDYVMFPYNFIHARAGYSQFLPAATRKGIGLIAIKPLAAGLIVTTSATTRITPYLAVTG